MSGHHRHESKYRFATEMVGGLNGSTQHFILNDRMERLVMDQRYRRGFTAVEKSEMWDRWQRGESLKSIGRVFGNGRLGCLLRHGDSPFRVQRSGIGAIQ